MFSTDLDFQKDLAAHHVYTAWQFIEYTQKNISIAEYCAEIIQKIVEKISQKTIRWEQNLFADFTEEAIVDGKKVRRTTITTANAPTYELRVAGEKVNPWFLFDKLLRDFYQYTMNSFDSISQIANSGLLANNGKKLMLWIFKEWLHVLRKPHILRLFLKLQLGLMGLLNLQNSNT